jgi:hypothetical protein
MKQNRNTRAFALVVTLMVSLIIAMMLGATLALSPGRLARAGNTGDQALAESAIEAGIEYARARLQENPLWKGDLNTVVVNETNLYIEERDGMVVGLLRPNDSEPFSMFRIRFNFYNGGPLADPLDDGLADPPANFTFDLRDVSVNNLEGSTRWVPEPDGSNTVASVIVGRFELPAGTVALGVEGFGGNGLSRLAPGNFDPPPGSRTFSRRTANVVLAIAFADGATDAAMMGGGNLDFTLPVGSGAIEVKAKGELARARTKGDVLMNAGGGDTPNFLSSGELRYDASGGIEQVMEDAGVSVMDDGGSPFYELEWDDIHKADNLDPSKAIRIPGGTYVFDDSGELFYFDMTWATYKTHVANEVGLGNDPYAAGTLMDSDMGNLRSDTMPSNVVDIDPSKSKLTFSKDVNVIDSGTGISDFTLVPQRGTAQNSVDGTDLTLAGGSSYAKDVELELKPTGTGKAALTTRGDTLIATKISSDKGGSIVTEGDLRLDAGKLDKLGNVGVSLYSQKDIAISTFEPSSGKYQDMGVDGLFYAWSDFDILTGEVGVLEADWGKVDIKGSVVAYGTNAGPSLEPPGTSGGTIKIVAEKAKFEWDSKKLGDLLDISKFGELTVLKRASYIRR